MKVELLFPELCGLYGDTHNAKYLAAGIPGGELTEARDGVPAFVREKVDAIVLGSMTERNQGFALERLMPYREQLRDLIEGGTVFLATGNSMELFGQEIRVGESALPCLGIFDYRSVRRMDDRRSCFFLGQFEGMEIVGNKGQFSYSYGTEARPFIRVTGGFGSNPESANEGWRYKNFFGTYLLGPFLPLNPPFTRYLLSVLGSDGPVPFEKESLAAYEYRLRELKRPGRKFLFE